MSDPGHAPRPALRDTVGNPGQAHHLSSISFAL